jgi:uroporphyrinogen-III synthase
MSVADTQSAKPLRGISVIVTRPTATAAALVDLARDLGARVVCLPGVELCACEDMQGMRHKLTESSAADAWIFTSPSAVKFAVLCLGSLSTTVPLRVFAVGAGTAKALQEQDVVALSPLDQHDSDGLLGMHDLQHVEGWRIAIIDAPGGRDVIAPALRARGAQVDRMGVYQRVAPNLSAQHWEQLAHAPLPWISLVSSGEALEHLHAAMPAEWHARWHSQPIVLSSQRLADRAELAGFKDRHIARSALVEDLLEGAIAVAARHRL